MYCTAPLSPRKGRLISFHDDDDDDDDVCDATESKESIGNCSNTDIKLTLDIIHTVITIITRFYMQIKISPTNMYE